MAVTAYVIEPEMRTVFPTEFDALTLEQMYSAIGCQCVTTVPLPDGNACYVDDEGMLRPQKHFFCIEGNGFPLAGRGLIVGPADPSGRETNPTIPLAMIERMVAFLGARSAALIFAVAHAAVLRQAERLREQGTDVIVAHGELVYDAETDTAIMQ